MTVYVDPITTYGSRQWCHMAVGVNDDIEELHSMAVGIGLKRAWFQSHPLHPHYDLTPNKRRLAVQRGAVEVASSQELIRLTSKFMIESGG